MLANLAFCAEFVVLNPAVVEIFYMLEVEDQIKAIAKTQSSKIWPEEKTEKLPSVGTYIKPNLEKIVEISPDLVITSFHSKQIESDLKRFDIPYKEMEFNNLSDINKNISIISELTNSQDKASRLISEFNSKLQTIDKEKLKGKKGVFFYATSPMMAFSKETLPDDILNTLGIDNIANLLDGKTPIIQTEFLIEQNPDFILIVGSDIENFIKSNQVLKHTKAYKNGHIFKLSSSAFLRGSPLIIDEIQKIYKKLI